jgi:hypothetical protein
MLVACCWFTMGLEDFTGDPQTDPEKVIRERIPENLESLALKINDAVQQTVGDGNYRVEGSGDGVTFYPTLSNHANYAFITVQPNRGNSYLYIHFDPSAKKRVSANPIPNSTIPTAREIPSNWKWNGSFRLSIEIESVSDIDSDVRAAIKKSFKQLKQ